MTGKTIELFASAQSPKRGDFSSANDSVNQEKEIGDWR